jgi:hypothetical protein
LLNNNIPKIALGALYNKLSILAKNSEMLLKMADIFSLALLSMVLISSS